MTSSPHDRPAAPARTELPPDITAQPSEHFIPLRKADLVQLLAAGEHLAESERGQFLELCKLISSTIHFDFHEKLEELKNDYAPLDPDLEEQPRVPLSAEQIESQAAAVFERFAALMQRANFRRLTDAEVRSALESTSHWGLNLHVDFNIFERLDVYARGDVVGRRSIRRWQNFYRTETVGVPTYQRLVVAFRLKDGEASDKAKRPIVMKLFKNIPKVDLEMLLPGTQVRMTLFDQGKIWLPTLSGLGVALYKIALGAASVAFAGMYGLISFLVLVGGTIGYGVRAFFGYLRTKDKYQLNLARSLYYQNLDNNAGVLFRLLDEAEEQEFREAILAYYLLWRDADDGGWTAPQIDRAAERLLYERAGLKVDFEIDDALDKLRRMNLIELLPEGKWRAIAIQAALQELDRAWDNFFRHHESAKASSKKHVLRMLQAA